MCAPLLHVFPVVFYLQTSLGLASFLQLAYHISGEFVPKEKLNRTTFKGWKQTFKPTAQVAAVKRVNSFKTDEQVVE